MSINPITRNIRQETNAVALFIAELIGAKAPTEQLKTDAGYNAWINNQLHDFNPTLESDRADFHENIWLQRLYAELDLAFQCDNKFSRAAYQTKQPIPIKWTVPIELDASALTKISVH